jgi:hypothetical protein
MIDHVAMFGQAFDDIGGRLGMSSMTSTFMGPDPAGGAPFSSILRIGALAAILEDTAGDRVDTHFVPPSAASLLCG